MQKKIIVDEKIQEWLKMKNEQVNIHSFIIISHNIALGQQFYSYLLLLYL